MINDEFRIHPIPGNRMRPNLQDADGSKDRMQLLKYAIFYLVVAVILLVSNQAARSPMAGANQAQPTSNLHIDLSVARKLEPNHTGNNSALEAPYVVRFRLTNQGNQSIFYPVFANTNLPIGHLVYRIAPGSDWRPLSVLELSTSSQLNAKGDIAWVEMPPGGWADGEYDDPGSPVGEHAYELELKLAPDGRVSRLVSHPYLTSAN